MMGAPHNVVRPLERAPAARAESPARVEIVRSTSDFYALRSEWDELLEHSAAGCVFLTWEWLYTWWWHQGEGRRLALLTVHQDECLIALAPLCLAASEPRRAMPIRRLEWLGSGSVGSDYLDVIVRRGCEPAALRALADRLAEQGLTLRLQRVRRSSFTARLAAELAARGFAGEVEPGGVCPYIDLGSHTWESYLGERSAAHRYSLRRKTRKLHERFDVRLELAQDRAETDRSLTALFDLHDLRWDVAGGSTALHTAELRRFHREFCRLALDRGWLRLFVLRLEGRPVAALYGLRYGDVFYFYQSGFDPALRRFSLGLVTLGRTIEAAFEEGALEFDLLHGVESYKFHWATRVRELDDLWIYPPSIRGRLHHALVVARRKLIALARKRGSRP